MKPTTINDLLTQASLRIAAETVWGEARGESYEGKLAVAWVIRRRVDEPAWWGRDVVSVCCHEWQFSCRNANDPNAAKLAKVPDDDPAYVECLRAVEEAFLGEPHENPTASIGGASHYKVVGTTAMWDDAASKLPSITIGRHIFFNLGPKG